MLIYHHYQPLSNVGCLTIIVNHHDSHYAPGSLLLTINHEISLTYEALNYVFRAYNYTYNQQITHLMVSHSSFLLLTHY